MVSSYTLDTEFLRATLNRSPLMMAYLLGASKSHALMAWKMSSRKRGSPMWRSCSGTMYSSSHASASGGKRGSWKTISLPPLPRQQPLYDRAHARRNHRRPRLDLALQLGVAVFQGVDARVVIVQLALNARLQAVEALVGLDPHLLDQVIEHVNAAVFHVPHPFRGHQKSAPCGARKGGRFRPPSN